MPYRSTHALLASLTVLLLVLALPTPLEARRSGAKRASIDMVVLHSTGGPTCDASTNRLVWISAGELDENLRNIEAHPVLGIHYMIGRDGTLRRSIPEDQIGFHVFFYSERSIAVELVNDGDGRDPFPNAQLAALVALLQDIAKRRGIGRASVKRHSDLDQGALPCDRRQRRKVDPGAAFPFEAVLDRVYSR
jgi:N-acetylmuramoyl-L-alanine amidase